MFSLFIRNLFFTLLQPGLVAGLFPYWILGRTRVRNDLNELGSWEYIGLIIFFTGFLIMLHCITLFATKGRGTLSPADPTRKLVISGLYKFSRNPMYMGVMLMLIGETVLFESRSLLYYSIFIFVSFNLFILLVEESRLKRDFGDAYDSYKKRVRMWL